MVLGTKAAGCIDDLLYEHRSMTYPTSLLWNDGEELFKGIWRRLRLDRHVVDKLFRDYRSIIVVHIIEPICALCALYIFKCSAFTMCLLSITCYINSVFVYARCQLCK